MPRALVFASRIAEANDHFTNHFPQTETNESAGLRLLSPASARRRRSLCSFNRFGCRASAPLQQSAAPLPPTPGSIRQPRYTLGHLQFFDMNRIADIQRATSTLKNCRDIERQTFDLDFAHDRLQNAAAHNTYCLADKMKRHMHLNLRGEIDFVKSA